MALGLALPGVPAWAADGPGAAPSGTCYLVAAGDVWTTSCAPVPDGCALVEQAGLDGPYLRCEVPTGCSLMQLSGHEHPLLVCEDTARQSTTAPAAADPAVAPTTDPAAAGPTTTTASATPSPSPTLVARVLAATGPDGRFVALVVLVLAAGIGLTALSRRHA